MSGSTNADAFLDVKGYAGGAVQTRLWSSSGGNGVVGTISNHPLLLYTNNGEKMRITTGGNVGIGTTTPYSRLEVWGPDSGASTTAFLVANSASTTEFYVSDNGNAVLAGGLTQNSDQRLKSNIQPLDASSSLAAINALNPVTFNWIDPSKGGEQLGFLAQQVFPIFPDLISTTSPTALTPDGTLGLNYTGLIAPIVKAIQALSSEITSSKPPSPASPTASRPKNHVHPLHRGRTAVRTRYPRTLRNKI